MLVQRVVPAGSRAESWTVLGEDDRPVEAIERYLGYLTFDRAVAEHGQGLCA